MDLLFLQRSIESLATSGSTVSNEDFTVLENSLYVLQNENHFHKIYLWGRIYGLENDYLIAYGYQKDALCERTYYYSTNCLDWGLLPHATQSAKTLFPLCTDPFQGDPAARSLILGDKFQPGEIETKELKEENRLSACVAAIMDEAAIIPRGALYHRPDDIVTCNDLFHGLTNAEMKSFASFQHFRHAQHRWNTNLLIRKDYDWSTDFLDTIDCDIPTCTTWSLQLECGGALVILRSLYWPGMTFYHRLGTKEHGFYYCGIGRKNLDLPFMFESLG